MLLDIKEKPPKFAGDRLRYGSIARFGVPPALAIRKRLSWYDFSPMPDSGDCLWATRTAITPPIDAILALRDAGLKIAPKASRLLEPFSERNMADIRPDLDPAEALKSNPSPGDAPGMKALRIGLISTEVLPKQNGRPLFFAPCARGDGARAMALEACGFFPLSVQTGNGPVHGYYTADPLLVAPFRPFMTPNARVAHADGMKRMSALIASSSATAPDVEIPGAEGLDYMSFQKAGILRAAASEALLIADDMGLGKTIQATGALQLRPDLRDVLIVCQASGKINWKREIVKWLQLDETEAEDIGVAEGDFLPDTRIVVINQDILARHKEALKARKWDAIFVDEAHNFSNPEAQRTVALMGDIVDPTDPNAAVLDGLQPRKGGLMLQLTGTPFANGPANFWSLGRSLDPVLFGTTKKDREIFENRYCAPFLFQAQMKNGRKQTLRNAKGGAHLSELQARLRGSVMVRRVKSDPRIIAELPPKLRSVVELPIRIDRETAQLLKRVGPIFDALSAEIRNTVIMPEGDAIRHGQAAAQEVSADDPWAGYVQAAGLCRGERVDFEDYARVRRNLAMLKAPILAEMMADDVEAALFRMNEERPTGKLLIFGHHTDALEMIANAINRRVEGSAVTYLGKTSPKARQEAVDRLQEDPGVRAFVGSGAAATTITLTAADRVVCAEFDPRPYQMLQLEDRAWRKGQLNSVLVQLMVVNNTPEVGVAHNLVEKMRRIEKGTGSIISKDMDAETIAGLATERERRIEASNTTPNF